MRVSARFGACQAPHPRDTSKVGMGEDTDEALIRRSGGGDKRAFGQLVRKHGPALQRFVRQLVKDDALTEDVVQQSLIDAYRGAASFRGDAHVKTWLFTIARNTACRTLRRQQKTDEVPLLELGLEAGWGSDPEILAIRSEQTRRLKTALASLSEDDREVLWLRDIEQLTGPEAAKILDIPLGAMKSRLHRARLRLAAALRGQQEGDLHA